MANVKLTDVCKTIFAGGDVPKDNYSLEQDEIYSIPIYTNGEQNNGLYGYTTKARVSEPSITVSARGTIGFTAIRTMPFYPAIRLITLTPNEKIDIRYLYYVTQNYKFDNGGTSIPQLTVPMLKNYSFPLPPLETQRQIATNLDKVTHTIDLCNAILEKLDLLVKSRFVEMFGDPVTNPLKWNVKPVIDECECMVPGRDKPKSFTGDIPWITIEDLIVNGITEKSKSGLGLTIDEIKEVNRKVIPVGSVIMSCVGNLGICSIAGREMIINQQLHSFQCGDNLNNVFLMYNLTYRKDYMNKWARNTTVLYMNKTICNSIPIMLPPLDLQQQFAAFVEQTDKSKLAVKQVLEKAETLKKALMQEYFG